MLSTSILLAAIVALVIYQSILFILQRLHKHRTFLRLGIPGPKPHFIHGNLYNTRREAYVSFAHKMHDKYGKNVGMFLGEDPFLMTKDLDLIQQVFVAKSRIFYNRMNFYLNVDPVPDNLICQRGERWRYMRKLLTPAFSNSRIKSSYFYRDSEKTVQKFMKQLETNSRVGSGHGRVTFVDDLYDRMAAVALDVIIKTAFHMDNMISFDGPLDVSTNGARFRFQSKQKQDSSAQTSKSNTFLSTVKLACRLGFNPLVELIFCFPFLDKPLTFLCNQLYFGSIIRLLFDRLDYLVRKYPATARASPVRQSSPSAEEQRNSMGLAAAFGDSAADNKHDDDELKDQNNNIQTRRRRIVDSLIEVLREKKITRSEFTGNAFVIVFAGFETTANAFTFTLWLLSQHQQVQRKLRRELLEQMAKLIEGKAPAKDAATEDLTDLELAELAVGCDYLEMVINESLRLYPPVPGLACRQASADCELSNGMKIEKGVNIIPSVYSIHRDKSIWGENANKFQPERFETFSLNQLNSAMFMPFGLGPRNCIGKAAAMHELKIVIGRLVLNYSIEPQPGRTPEKLKLCSPINITITSADKISMNFVKLTNKN